jgi:hypothetical protein
MIDGLLEYGASLPQRKAMHKSEQLRLTPKTKLT